MTGYFYQDRSKLQRHLSNNQGPGNIEEFELHRLQAEILIRIMDSALALVICNNLTIRVIRNIKLAQDNRAFILAGVAQHGQRRKTEALIP